MSQADSTIRALRASTYRVQTVAPEADGTARWDATELVVVQVEAAGSTGLGWSYCPVSAAGVINALLAPIVLHSDAFDIPGTWTKMIAAVRNAGRPGLVSMAVAAVDTALWDLKARLLNLPLHRLLGAVRDQVPVYGSGGFVSQSDDELVAQLRGWVDDLGIPQVKIKVGEAWGSEPARDLARVRLARETIGDDVELFVDANGGYSPAQARRLGRAYDDLGVTWFEEPLSSDDLPGLAALRCALRCDIAAGEYIDGIRTATRMLAAGAVDCLQIDVTRCAGISEWLRCASIAAGFGLDVSAHCAPSLHASPAAAVPNLRHIEYFADHARLEPMLFDGVLRPDGGYLQPSREPGNALRLRPEAENFRC